MPVYNRAGTVARCINSVLSQSFENFEFVIVDDGSTDNTAKVIADLSDPRIKLLRQPSNMGGNAARNRAIRESTAPLVSFIDSDDEFLPHKLQTITDYFKHHPNIEAVIDSFELQYPLEKGGKTASRVNPELASSAAVEEGIFNRTIFKATPAISARRAALERIGGFDETLRRRQDMDLVLRLAEKTEIRTINAILWRKHWSPAAISAKQETFLPALLDICERHPQYITNPIYRKGLARDFARHLLRLSLQGKPGVAVNHAKTFAQIHGSKLTRNLIASGCKEILKRGLG
jgi:glycosyltransferase involved in cell wall biosynthesis